VAAACGLAAALALLAAAARTPRAAAQVAAPAPPPHPTCVAVVGNQAVTTDELFQVLLWDLNNLAAPVDDFQIHNKKASYVFATSDRVFSASYDGVVNVSPLAPPRKPARQFKEHWAGPNKPEVWAVAVSTDGTRAVSSTNDGQILVWKTAPTPYNNASVEKDLRPDINSSEEIGGLAFIPGNKNRFLSGHADGQLILWDLTNLAAVQRFNFGPINNNLAVNSVAVTGNGSRVATGSFDKSVVFWDVASRARSAVQPDPAHAHTDYVWRVAFSPDDSKLASAGEDGKVKIWDSTTGAFIIEFDAGSYGTMGVAWADNHTVVFTGDGATPAVQKGIVP
jgi:WD40 repeat protein